MSNSSSQLKMEGNNSSSHYRAVKSYLNDIVAETLSAPRVDGLKKMAKACTRTLTQRHSTNTEKTDTHPPKYEDVTALVTLRRLNSKGYNDDCDSDWQNLQSNRSRKISLSTSTLGSTQSKSLNYESLEKKRQDSDKTNIQSIDNSISLSSLTINEEWRIRRVVTVRKIPKNVGIDALLAQACGGPLESVEFRESKFGTVAELHFIYPEDAKNFYHYGTRTGLLVLNGTHLKVAWADKTNTENLDYCHKKVPKYLMNEILQNGARRCLILSQNIKDNQEKLEKKMHYPNPRTHLCPKINAEEIRQRFSSYGIVIDVCPIISKNICICIHFADIRSAIVAKRECELEGTEMNSLYKEWSFWYGKDPVDRPCLLI